MAKTVNIQKIKPFYLSMKALLLSALVLTFLQGCGAKGELYQTPEPLNAKKVSSKDTKQGKKANNKAVSEQQTIQLNEKPI